MKRRMFKGMLALILVFAMMAGSSLALSAADMAYNIYSDPDFGGEEQAFDTYTIEFMSTQTPYYTYWALSNFSVKITDFTHKKYGGLTGGGGYAGLQDRGPREGYGHSAIMAFWEWFYTDKDGKQQSLRASRMYPSPELGDNGFTGEGEGNNWITPYDWKDNQWYRMVIHTWNDPETGTTLMGQWFQDMTTGEWTLISYFNTHMINSYLSGNQHFFMENYVGSTSGEERDAYLKNMYVRMNNDKTWKSIASTTLKHCNNSANNKTGNHSFGATQEYFWAKSGGAVPSGQTQAQLDASQPAKKFTITQPATPTFGSPVLNDIKLVKGEDGKWSATWEMDKTGTPQLSYFIEVKDIDGKRLFTKNAFRPEVVTEVLEGVDTDAFTCRVMVTDLFGETVSMNVSTNEYKALVPEEDEKDDDEADPPVTVPENDDDKLSDKKDNGSIVLIIGIVAAVVVIGGIGAVVVLKKKKK